MSATKLEVSHLSVFILTWKELSSLTTPLLCDQISSITGNLELMSEFVKMFVKVSVNSRRIDG